MTKVCIECAVEKTLEEFHRNGSGRRNKCKTCRIPDSKESYDRDPERGRAYSAKYRRENHETVKQSVREWAAANVEKKRDYMQRYYLDRKADWRTGEHNRRAAQVGAEGTHTTRDWLKTLRRFGGKCAYCEDVATERDHIIPLSRGGSNWIGNIVPACQRCNSTKKTRFVSEWRALQLAG